ncbi:MAG TPA: serine/threonine-protein kinase [Polyangiaceae bacterium]|nr:serine/threonine-protein kinase [Polyangiaceae bacterium]
MTKALQPGSVFGGRYEIVRCIGSGGMGAVYEVLHRDTRRRRALKVLLPVLVSDADARARFAQEATITADIVSDNLVDVFDAGVDDDTGCPFIVLELLRGESLGDALARGRRFAAAEAIEILRQIARALDKTHAAGIVHRDLKPDNLFAVTREDGATLVKILDFGIAKMVEEAGKSRNTVNIGTPLYMSPEQLHGARIDGRTDLYSLGHIAFELLTGESYWEAEVRALPSTLALVAAIQRGYPEAPRVRAGRLGLAVDATFDRWFLRAVAPNPDDRFRSGAEMVEALAMILGVQPGARASLPEGLAPMPAVHAPPRVEPPQDFAARSGAIPDPPSYDRTTSPFSGARPALTNVESSPQSEALSGVSRPRLMTGRGGASSTQRGLLVGAALGGAALFVGATALLLSGGRVTREATSATVASPPPSADSTAAAAATAAAPTGEPASVGSAATTASAAASSSAAKSAATASARPTATGRRNPVSTLCRREPSRCR